MQKAGNISATVQQLVGVCPEVNLNCLGYLLTSKHIEVAEVRLSCMSQGGSRRKCLCIDINECRLNCLVSLLIAEEAYILYYSTIETNLGFVSKIQSHGKTVLEFRLRI